MKALGYFGAPAVPVLIRVMMDADRKPYEIGRSSFDTAFVRIGEPAAAPLAELVSSRTSSDMLDRVLGHLAALGPAAARTQPALMARIRTLNPDAQVAALQAIKATGEKTPERLALLLDLSANGSTSSVRAEAMRGLLPFGAAVRPASSVLTAAIASPDTLLRAAALNVLGGDDPYEPRAVGSVRLPGIGTPSEAVPSLIRMLSDSTWSQKASLALRFAGPEAVPHLKAVLASGRDPARLEVLDILANTDPRTMGTVALVPDVVRSLSGLDTMSVRSAGFRALQHIGTATPAAKADRKSVV